MDYPEFIRESKNFPFPYSIYESLIGETIDFDSVTEHQAHSIAWGVRLTLTARPQTQHWILPIPEDYYLHLETIRAYWPVSRAPIVLFVNITDPVHGRQITHEPIPLHLLTTPALGSAIAYRVHLNTLFGARQMVSIEISNQTGTDPDYVDLMVDGLLIPREKVDL